MGDRCSTEASCIKGEQAAGKCNDNWKRLLSEIMELILFEEYFHSGTFVSTKTRI